MHGLEILAEVRDTNSRRASRRRHAPRDRLAVLRRAGLVESSREGASVRYALSTPAAADLLAAGRRILGSVLADRGGLLVPLQADGADQ